MKILEISGSLAPIEVFIEPMRKSCTDELMAFFYAVRQTFVEELRYPCL